MHGIALFAPPSPTPIRTFYETLAHGATEPNLSLKPLLEDFWWPVVENRQTLETIRISTEYSALESMTSGVTLCNDILEAPFAEREASVC